MTETEFQMFRAWFVGAPTGAIYHSHDGYWRTGDGKLRKQERTFVSGEELAWALEAAGIRTQHLHSVD
jgi:hypothetical protein